MKPIHRNLLKLSISTVALLTLLSSFAASGAQTTVTGSPGVGQGLANFFHQQPGDKVSVSTTVVTAPNGSIAVIATWTITLAPPPVNSYRDPKTGQVIEIPPDSVVVPDPAGAPVIPGAAKFRIQISIDTPELAGAEVNIGGNITTDNQAAANPQGIFKDIDDYIASLFPPTIILGPDDLPFTVGWYPLSFDDSSIAQGLTQMILMGEGITDLEAFTVSVSPFFDDSGNRAVLYGFAAVPEPSTWLLIIIGIVGLLRCIVPAKIFAHSDLRGSDGLP
jgi:hypothetical protein